MEPHATVNDNVFLRRLKSERAFKEVGKSILLVICNGKT